MFYFQENNIFQGSRGAPTFFLGGEGAQLLIPYRNPYNFSFFWGGGGGSGPLAPPPLDQRMQCLDQLDAVTKVRYEKKLSILNLPGYPYM